MSENNKKADISKEYSGIKIKLSILNLFLTLAFLLILVFSPVSIMLREAAGNIFASWQGVVLGYFALLFLISSILDLPLDIYSSFYLEHKYDLSNQTFFAWVIDLSKKKFLSFALGGMLVLALYAVIRIKPDDWWLYCWGGWILLSLVLGKIVPTFIVPLFYKYSPIEDENILDMVKRVVKGTKLDVKNVYSINLSKTTKKANAAFLGLGRSKRVVLGDTLINSFSIDEIETVLAHEVGHFKRKHIVKNMLSSIIVSLAAFYISFTVLNNLVVVLGYDGVGDVAAFPLISLVFFVFNLMLLPLQNMFSRLMENEADDYAVSVTGLKDSFISAMNKLAEQNLSDKEPNPLIEFVFYSHPSISKRINRVSG